MRRLTVELDSAKRVIWHVPDFVQLAVSGTHKGQTASILDQIMPAVASGRVLLMSELTPAALTRLLQQWPGLRTVFELVRLERLDDSQTTALARDVAARLSAQGIGFEREAFDAATQLSRHCLDTGEMPGALLDLMKLSVKRVTTRGDANVTRDDVLATVRSRASDAAARFLEPVRSTGHPVALRGHGSREGGAGHGLGPRAASRAIG